MPASEPSPSTMRCERCRAVFISTDAVQTVERHAPCGVCGGTLLLARREPRHASASPERRLLRALRDAGGDPLCINDLAEHGIDDPASAIYELERAGHRIGRAYEELGAGRRRFLGYRLCDVAYARSHSSNSR